MNSGNEFRSEAVEPEQVVLVIDDDPNNLAIVSDYLEDCHFTCLTAEDGESGLRRADFAQPDLVLLDIMMPGIDGYETCRRLKSGSTTKDIPVIFMTALAEIEHKVKGFEVGAVDYISKPFQRDELLARVGVHLRIRELSSKLRRANESLERRVEERTAELRNSERRLADTLNLVPDPTFAIDLAGVIILWNRPAEEVTGVKAEVMLGKGNHEYAIPFYGTRRALLVDLVLNSVPEAECLYPAVRREGNRVIGEAYFETQQTGRVYAMGIAAPLYDSEGKVIGAIESIRDITDRKRAEEALRESEERYRTIVDTSLEGIWMITPDMMTTFVNARMAQMLGYTCEELTSRPVTEFMFEEDARDHFKRIETRRTGMGENYERRFRCKDGTELWTHVSATPIFDQEHRFKGSCAMFTDITEQRQAQQALKQAKEEADAANRTKDRFLAVLSHELRTPLTPVLAMVSGLEEEVPEELRADMQMIRRNMEMEARLIDDLLDVTRISQEKVELRPEVVDAHVVLRTALEICEGEIQSKHIEVSLDLAATNSHVHGDPTRLRQVFWNLLKNAVEYSAENGQVSVETKNVDGSLQMAIQDQGAGISPELLPRIFNAFERGEQKGSSRFGGLGLGLSIAKSVVEMHHGSISAQSEGKGKGARFTVVLPVTASRSEQPEKPGALPSFAATEAPWRILLVDDHQDTLCTMARLLGKSGYSVRTADCVRAAVGAANEGGFDILISDLGLPDGSGLDIMKTMKQRDPSIRGIALSGFGTEEDVRQSIDVGFDRHLTKPVSAQLLRETVSAIIPKLPSVTGA